MPAPSKPGRKRKTTAKPPSLQFYTGDWKKDPALSMCSPATRGIWMDAVCGMFDGGRTGYLTGSVEALARVCRCRPDEMITAVNELITTGAGDVYEGAPIIHPEPPSGASWADSVVRPPVEMPAKCALNAPRNAGEMPPFLTLVNRRMWADFVARKVATAQEKRRYWARKEAQPGAVPGPDPGPNLGSLSSSSSSDLFEGVDPSKREAPSGAPALPGNVLVGAGGDRAPPITATDPPRAEAAPPSAGSRASPSGGPPIDLGRAKPAVMALVERHRDVALRIFAALDAARRRLKPRAHLQPSYDALAGIAGRLEAGKTEAQCLHVVAVYETEAAARPEAWRFFDAVSPWRPENFERALGREVTAAELDAIGDGSSSGGGGGASARASPLTDDDREAFPYRMPNGRRWPREIEKLVENLSLDEARGKVDFLRRAEPFRFDEQGMAKF